MTKRCLFRILVFAILIAVSNGSEAMDLPPPPQCRPPVEVPPSPDECPVSVIEIRHRIRKDFHPCYAPIWGFESAGRLLDSPPSIDETFEYISPDISVAAEAAMRAAFIAAAPFAFRSFPVYHLQQPRIVPFRFFNYYRAADHQRNSPLFTAPQTFANGDQPNYISGRDELLAVRFLTGLGWRNPVLADGQTFFTRAAALAVSSPDPLRRTSARYYSDVIHKVFLNSAGRYIGQTVTKGDAVALAEPYGFTGSPSACLAGTLDVDYVMLLMGGQMFCFGKWNFGGGIPASIPRIDFSTPLLSQPW